MTHDTEASDTKRAAVRMALPDNETLKAFSDWGDVRMPIAWYVSYGLVIGLWFASHDFDRWVTIMVSVLLLGMMAGQVTFITRRTGTSVPRLRNMPPPLRRVYLWPVVAGCVTMTAGIFAVTSGGPAMSGFAVGAVVALLMTGLAITTEWRYRAVVRRLMGERGLRP